MSDTADNATPINISGSRLRRSTSHDEWDRPRRLVLDHLSITRVLVD
jgi:hypothetical protein